MLDDLEVGDSVCFDCGLVLDRIVGRCRADRGQGSLSGRAPPPPPPGEEGLRDRLVSLLALFSLDAESNVDDAADIYLRVFGPERRRALGIRWTSRKEDAAVAFAVCQSMNNCGSPRSFEQVARYCGLPSDRPLLDLPATLGVSRSLLPADLAADFELGRVPPESLVDPVCAHVGIRFADATEMRAVAANAEWEFYGHKPAVIAAAAIASRLPGRGSSPLVRSVCELLSCSPERVLRLAERLV